MSETILPTETENVEEVEGNEGSLTEREQEAIQGERKVSKPKGYNGRKYFEETIAKMYGGNSPYVFYAYLLSQCKIHIDQSLPAPAGVNFTKTHYNLYINPVMFDKFTDAEKTAVLVHEAGHIMYNHITVRMKKDHERWNYAGDIAINQEIQSLPEGCLMPDQFSLPENKSADQYYEALENNKQFKQQQKQQKEMMEKIKKAIEEALENGDLQPGDLPNGGKGMPIDTHELWEDSNGDPLYQDEVLKRMLEKAVTQTQKSRGNVPSSVLDQLELLNRKPKVDWRKALRKITGNKKANKRPTRKRRSRRFQDRMEIPGQTSDVTFDLAVILDVSGSMSDKEIMDGLTEIKDICKKNNSTVKIVQVDTNVHAVEDFDKNSKGITRSGCGGTRMEPGFKYMVENGIKFNALITISDMYIESLDEWETVPKVPMMFLDTTNDSGWKEAHSHYKNVKVYNINDKGQAN